MSKKWLVGLLAGMIILSLGGCNWMEKKYQEAAGTTFKVSVLKGPNSIGMIKMMEPSIKPSPRLGDTVEFTMEENLDLLQEKLLNGEIEVAAIPTNLAAKLYNNGAEYQLAALDTAEEMYVLTNGLSINRWSDLKGQEVQIAAKDSASDAVFTTLLTKNGIDAKKDITLKYISNPRELAQKAITGNSKITVLSEPWVSMVLKENSKIQKALNIKEEWTRINGTDVPYTPSSLLVKKEIAAKNPEELSLLLDDYADSINWVNKHPQKAAQLVAKHKFGLSEDVAETAIPKLNLRYINAKEVKPSAEKYLQALQPETIGDKLPDETFYYQK